MEIIDEHGELCAFCSDDPQDFIHIPPVEAIRLLTLKYIEQCGVSLGMRTLYYNAAEAWQEILASTPNHPLAKPAEELMLYELMPLICEAYKPELYDKYDITYYPAQKDWFSLIFNMKDEEVDAALRQKMGQFYYLYDGVQQVLDNSGIQARMPMLFTIE